METCDQLQSRLLPIGRPIFNIQIVLENENRRQDPLSIIMTICFSFVADKHLKIDIVNENNMQCKT